MKLYRKQLNSLDELKQEKARLLLLRKKTEQEDLFSLGDINPLGKKEGKKAAKAKVAEEEHEEGNAFGNIAEMLGGFVDADMLQSILGTAGGVLAGFTGKKLRTKVLIPLAKELLGAYVKWKAVELGFMAVKHFVKSRKKKEHE